MDIAKELSALEKLVEAYEECNEPEERLDLKQTITLQIKDIRKATTKLPGDLQAQVSETLSEFEEILTY